MPIKSNVLIQSANYGDGSGNCVVRWIVETAGSHGTNYAVHALCTSASQPDKTQIVNIICFFRLYFQPKQRLPLVAM